MTADTMEERIQAFATLARERTEERDKSVEDVVHAMTHESYLMQHTTGEVLKELGELQELYPDAFYNGAANDHIMDYFEGPAEFEFWYDHTYLSLAAGLEWAILEEIEESVADTGSPP